jgi:hypothetical protein
MEDGIYAIRITDTQPICQETPKTFIEALYNHADADTPPEYMPYFETQRQNECGCHALNNLIQNWYAGSNYDGPRPAIITGGNMKEFHASRKKQNIQDGSPLGTTDEILRQPPDGNYDMALLQQYVMFMMGYDIEQINHRADLLRSAISALAKGEIMGVLANLRSSHYVAVVRWPPLSSTLVVVDSLNGATPPMSAEGMIEWLWGHEWSNGFSISPRPLPGPAR